MPVSVGPSDGNSALRVAEGADRADVVADTGVLGWLAGAAVLEPWIGVVWQRGLGDALGIVVEIRYSVLLGISLWLVYAADRWLDAWRLPPGARCSFRHQFALRHRTGLALFWLLALGIDVLLAARTLRPGEWAPRLSLLAITGAYFLAVHRFQKLRHKEALVTFIYTAGVSLFAWPALRSTAAVAAGNAAPPIGALLAFAALVALNLGVISIAEQALDHSQGVSSLATQERRLSRWLTWIGVGLCVACAACALPAYAFRPWFLAVSSCALGLLLLARMGYGLGPDHFHLAADAILLLAVPFFWV